MKLGVSLPVFTADPARPLRVAARAASLGVEGVFSPDHFFPPVFYPLGRVAIEWRSAVLLLPTSAAAALVDAAAGLDPITTNEAILAAGALTVEAIALFAFGIYWARRTAREP